VLELVKKVLNDIKTWIEKRKTAIIKN